MSSSSAILSRVDCNTAPNCFSINRVNCSSSAGTCSECLPGFYGVEGDSNSPCTRSISLKPTLLKTCIQSCSGSGTCVFVSIVDESKLSTCLFTDTTCVAVCSCSTRYYGSFCQYTLSEFSLMKQGAAHLVRSVNRSLSIDISNPYSVKSLQAVLSVLPSDASLYSQDVVSSLLSTCTENVNSYLVQGISSDDTSGTLNVLNIAASTILQQAVSPSRRRLTTTSYTFQDLLTSYSMLYAVNMAPLQKEISRITSTVRYVFSTSRSRFNFTLSAPVTSLERIVNKHAPTVVAISHLELGSAVSLAFYGSKSQSLLSAVTRVQINDVRSCGRNECQISVLASNYKNTDYLKMTIQNSSHFYCDLGSHKAVFHTCHNGDIVVRHCNGTEGYIVIACKVYYKPSCDVISFPGDLDNRASCSLKNYSNVVSQCSCVLYSLNPDVHYGVLQIGVNLVSDISVDYAFFPTVTVENNNLISFVAGIFSFLFLFIPAMHFIVTRKAGTMKTKQAPEDQLDLKDDQRNNIYDYMSKNVFETIFSGVFSNSPRSNRTINELCRSVTSLKLLNSSEPFQFAYAVQSVTRYFVGIFVIVLILHILFPANQLDICQKYYTRPSCSYIYFEILSFRYAPCVWAGLQYDRDIGECLSARFDFSLTLTIIIATISVLITSVFMSIFDSVFDRFAVLECVRGSSKVTPVTNIDTDLGVSDSEFTSIIFRKRVFKCNTIVLNHVASEFISRVFEEQTFEVVSGNIFENLVDELEAKCTSDFMTDDLKVRMQEDWALTSLRHHEIVVDHSSGSADSDGSGIIVVEPSPALESPQHEDSNQIVVQQIDVLDEEADPSSNHVASTPPDISEQANVQPSSIAAELNNEGETKTEGFEGPETRDVDNDNNSSEPNVSHIDIQLNCDPEDVNSPPADLPTERSSQDYRRRHGTTRTIHFAASHLVSNVDHVSADEEAGDKDEMDDHVDGQYPTIDTVAKDPRHRRITTRSINFAAAHLILKDDNPESDEDIEDDGDHQASEPNIEIAEEHGIFEESVTSASVPLEGPVRFGTSDLPSPSYRISVNSDENKDSFEDNIQSADIERVPISSPSFRIEINGDQFEDRPEEEVRVASSADKKPLVLVPKNILPRVLSGSANKVAPVDISPTQLIIRTEVEKVPLVASQLTKILDKFDDSDKLFLLMIAFVVDVLGRSTREGALLNNFLNSQVIRFKPKIESPTMYSFWFILFNVALAVCSICLTSFEGQSFIVELFFSALYYTFIMDSVIEIYSKYAVYFAIQNTIYDIIVESRDLLLQHCEFLGKEEVFFDKNKFCAEKYLFPSRTVACRLPESSVEKMFILLYSNVFPGRAGVWIHNLQERSISNAVKIFGSIPIMAQSIILSIVLGILLGVVLIAGEYLSDLVPWVVSAGIFSGTVFWILALLRHKFQSIQSIHSEHASPPQIRLVDDQKYTHLYRPGSADSNASVLSYLVDANPGSLQNEAENKVQESPLPEAPPFQAREIFCFKCGKSNNLSKKNGKIYCSSCLDKTCESCGRIEKNMPTIFSRDGQSLCLLCVDIVCRKCRSTTDIQMKFSFDGETLCRTCTEKLELFMRK